MLEIFVFLKHKLNASQWQKDNAAGLVADRTPYGYHLAEQHGCRLTFSKPHQEGCCLRFLRRLLRKLFQVDLIHAWRNREQIFKSQVVWTHTEYEFLALLLLFRFCKPRPRPKLIGQSVWLADHWHKLSSIKKFLYRKLTPSADVLTFHTQQGLDKMQAILKHPDCRLVKFGVSLESFPFQKKALQTSQDGKIKIATLGNDMHRDWSTFLSAFGKQKDFTVKIATSALNKSDVGYLGNIEVDLVRSIAGLQELYAWADLVVLPLRHNTHASGLTVICEAIRCGTPVVCTDTGDLRTYFSDQHICYVPPGSPDLIRQAAHSLARDNKRCLDLVSNSQKLLKEEQISSEGFVLRHVEISRQLVSREGP